MSSSSPSAPSCAKAKRRPSSSPAAVRRTRRTVGSDSPTKTAAEILSGVNAGDRVIVDGQAGLPDDAAITEGSAAKEGEPEAAGEKDGTK